MPPDGIANQYGVVFFNRFRQIGDCRAFVVVTFSPSHFAALVVVGRIGGLGLDFQQISARLLSNI